MGQEVKNPLRAQSKYGLMGSSAKTGKKIFRGSPEHFLDKSAIWDRTPPPPTHQLQSTCVGEGSRVPNLQTEFNYLDSFKSYGIFSDFVVPVVPTLSQLSPHRRCHPNIIPVSSPSSPHHPHSPRRSPCGPHGCGLRGLLCCLRGLHPMLSPWSPRRPCHPHIIPVSSPSSPHRPHGPQKVPMWSPWLWSPWSPLLSLWFPPHVVPVVPMSSPSSPCRPCVIPVISTSSRRSPHHP